MEACNGAIMGEVVALTHQENILLNPVERMELLVKSAKLENGAVAGLPLKRLYKITCDMYNVATSFFSEGNLEKSFVMYLRFVSLAASELPNHAEYQEEMGNLTKVTSLLELALKQIQYLEHRLNRVYQDEAQKLLDTMKERINPVQTKIEDEPSAPEAVKEQQRPTRDAPIQLLHPEEEEEIMHDSLLSMAVPVDLSEKFCNAICENTSNGVETIGFLAGISLMLVQETLGLRAMGWIHTHPKGICDLTIADLKIHYTFQKIHKEAIAMVVSPEGVETFIMTEAGMERAEQGFSHSTMDGESPPLFTAAEHVKFTDALTAIVIDMRKLDFGDLLAK